MKKNNKKPEPPYLSKQLIRAYDIWKQRGLDSSKYPENILFVHESVLSRLAADFDLRVYDQYMSPEVNKYNPLI